MYSISPLYESSELDDLIDEAMRLPVNAKITAEHVSVKAYYQEELGPSGDDAIIRTATDVEKMLLNVDVIITVSAIDTANYNHRDMLVMISNLVNLIETGYNGRSDVPVVFINSGMFRIIPSVVKYFGYDNAVLAPIYRKIGSLESSETYQETDADDLENGEHGMYRSMDVSRIVQGLPSQEEYHQ